MPKAFLVSEFWRSDENTDQSPQHRAFYWETQLVGMHAQLISRVQLFATPWSIAGQTPLTMEFFRQGYWSRLPFPSSLLLFKNFFKNFICLFLTTLGLHCFERVFSSCGKWGLLSSCGPWAFHCGGLSCCSAWALGHTGFSSFGEWA